MAVQKVAADKHPEHGVAGLSFVCHLVVLHCCSTSTAAGDPMKFNWFETVSTLALSNCKQEPDTQDDCFDSALQPEIIDWLYQRHCAGSNTESADHSKYRPAKLDEHELHLS